MNQLVVALTDVVVEFNEKSILSIPQLNVYASERIGVIGTNGAGKSTLLNLISGALAPSQGSVQRHIDFAQFTQVAAGGSQELEDYGLASRFNVPMHPLAHFSGGEETRLKLAETIGSYPPGLLLDEPTSHLDQGGITDLIDELTYYYGTVIMVSHDRHLLNQLATTIWELSDGQIKEYPGNYDAFLAQKKHEETRLSNQHGRYQQERRRLISAIGKKESQVARISTVSAKQKNRDIKPNRLSSTRQKDTVIKQEQKALKGLETRLRQLEEVPKLQQEQSLHFPVSPSLALHNPWPIRGSGLTLVRGERVLLDKVDFQVKRGSVIALTGANGSGKTSLLQTIAEGHEAVITSPKVVINSLTQHAYRFSQRASILDYALEESQYDERFVRSVLHRLHFDQGALEKSLTTLSGGERMRLNLALVFLQPSNVLLLDEPTNFLDLQSIEALESLLIAYQGTVILSSHDQTFIQRVATEVWQVVEQKLVAKL